MKKTLVLIFALLSVNFVLAQSVIISGRVASERRPADLSLVTIVDGNTAVIATAVPSADGSFGFAFNPDYEGFYMIGGAKDMDIQFPVYIKGGENFNVVINDKAISYEGKLSAENKILAQWVAMSEVVRNKSHYWMGSMSIYKDFFPEIEALAAKVPAFVAGINTKNAKFNDLMKDYVKFSTEYYAINYLMVPRSSHPTKDDMTSYYKTIVTPNHFVNDNVLQIPMSKRYLSMYVTFASEREKDIDKQLLILGTDKQKAEYLSYSVLSRFKSYDLYLDFVEKYGKYFATPAQKKLLEDTGAKLYETRSGGVAANFTYPDVNGKNVSLSDFKGKVVLVDVWATWCGPCKQQIPHAKKLEEELHGMDVVFLNVSVDEEKDKDKWKQMIIDEKLGGVHIFASGWSKITKDYKITGIPRFMLFDKNGNVISTEAPRPSDPALKTLIMKYLK
ncbi:MAG: TlpA disulfide reductase family protein [Bacteroidales bacterium]|nr:TlpA disulfide reductase family protein [Bacteroidales bacterium]